MHLHRWSACTLPSGRGPRGLAIVAMLMLLGGFASARADSGKPGHALDVDTEHLFGFTEGSDIDDPGEKLIETDSTGRFGKANGSYGSASTELELKYTITDYFRVTAAPAIAYYDMSGVSGLGDRRQAVVEGLSFDARFRLLDRTRAPFGMTISISPQWGLVDDTSGAPADQIGAEVLAIVDRELIPGWLFGAINLSYAPESTRLRATGTVERESMLGTSAGLSLQIAPGVFVGGEVRYLSHYDGLGLDAFSGQALYLGPALYVRLSERAFLSAGWNVQVWGSAAGMPGPLDLTHFERHQAKLRFGISF
jgi:hypothetical protein